MGILKGDRAYLDERPDLGKGGHQGEWVLCDGSHWDLLKILQKSQGPRGKEECCY